MKNSVKSSTTTTKFSQKISLIIFGLVLSAMILEAGLRIAGFLVLLRQESHNRISLRSQDSCRIMCIGESTTQGQYPKYLEEILNDSGNGIKFSVIDKGLAGTNTGIIMTMLSSWLDEYKPDIVVAMIGINDLGPNIVFTDPDTVYYPEKENFFSSLRIYKLLRLLKSHLSVTFGLCSPVELWLGPSIKSGAGDFKKTKGSYKDQPFLVDSERILRSVTKNNPGNYEGFVALGIVLRERSEMADAEKAFKKAINLRPGSYEGYLGLSLVYKNIWRFEEAVSFIRKAISLNPGCDIAYTELGSIYVLQKKTREAEKVFLKAFGINPDNEWASTGLVVVYLTEGLPVKAQEYIRKAIEAGENNEHVGSVEPMSGEKESACNKILQADPDNHEACIELGNIYMERKLFNKAEWFFRRAIETGPDDRAACTGLWQALYALSDKRLFNDYAGGGFHLKSVTINNYIKLKKILDERNITLVCMQYPMHQVSSLKMVFVRDADNVIFVDNGKVFSDAVKKYGYWEYFVDVFGGIFGHCTANGNRLLAQNLSNAIIKTGFSVKWTR